MKIWIFNHYATDPSLPGGTRHYDLSGELVKKGHKVTIFASSFHYSMLKETKKYNGSISSPEKIGEIKFVWIKTFPYSKNNWRRIFNMLSYSVRAYRIGKNHKWEPPDVILGSSVHLFAVYTAYLVAKRLQVPFIMEVRDLWPQTLIDMGMSKFHPLVVLLGIMEKFLYKKSLKIISLLPRANQYIESRGVPSDKIVWIPNGVIIRKRSPSAKNLTKSENPKSFLVTYTGAFGQANNLSIAIQAAKILQEKDETIKFLLVGDGPEKSKLEQLSKTYGLRNIYFKPPVSKGIIPEILANADVLFLCVKDLGLYKYGISFNKLYDYLASGKPVVYSCDSVNNSVEDAQAGITVPPNSPKDFSEAVLKIKSFTQKERANMGQKGIEYVDKHFNITNLAEKFETLCEQVRTS